MSWGVLGSSFTATMACGLVELSTLAYFIWIQQRRVMRSGLGITKTIVTGHILLVVCGLETLQLFCSSCIIMNDVNLNLHLSTVYTHTQHIFTRDRASVQFIRSLYFLDNFFSVQISLLLSVTVCLWSLQLFRDYLCQLTQLTQE